MEKLKEILEDELTLNIFKILGTFIHSGNYWKFNYVNRSLNCDKKLEKLTNEDCVNNQEINDILINKGIKLNNNFKCVVVTDEYIIFKNKPD